MLGLGLQLRHHFPSHLQLWLLWCMLWLLRRCLWWQMLLLLVLLLWRLQLLSHMVVLVGRLSAALETLALRLQFAGMSRLQGQVALLLIISTLPMQQQLLLLL